MRRFLLVFISIVLLSLAGCSDVDYYLQAVDGQLEVLHKSRNIHEIIADPGVSQELKQHLEQALHIRSFASRQLHLPDNGSYKSYADLQRPYVVWNVVATPEFSLQPVTWCFPIAGCVPYRGYFKQQRAREFGQRLQQEGRDVLVYGVRAYSTLNWFNDPLLSTFNNQSDIYLAALIFHELAHQKVYLAGDSDFNEAFAKTVEIEGVKRWLKVHGRQGDVVIYRQRLIMEEDFLRMARGYQQQLGRLYASDLSVKQKRKEKKRMIGSFQEEVRRFRDQRNDGQGFSAWLDPFLNNARFASLNTYYALVPAFQSLLALYGGDLQLFYRQVAEISTRPNPERQRILSYLGSRLRLASTH